MYKMLRRIVLKSVLFLLLAYKTHRFVLNTVSSNVGLQNVEDNSNEDRYIMSVGICFVNKKKTFFIISIINFEVINLLILSGFNCIQIHYFSYDGQKVAFLLLIL